MSGTSHDAYWHITGTSDSYTNVKKLYIQTVYTGGVFDIPEMRVYRDKKLYKSYSPGSSHYTATIEPLSKEDIFLPEGEYYVTISESGSYIPWEGGELTFSVSVESAAVAVPPSLSKSRTEF